MKIIKRLPLLLVCFILALCLPGTLPAQGSTGWTPGFYAGWVSFSARLDTDATWPKMTAFVIEKFNGRGQLMVKINDQGQGGASIVLPTSISILDYGKIQASNGDCTFSSSAIAQTNSIHLRREMSDVSDTFKVPLSLSPNIRFTKTNSSSFGTINGCEQAGAANLTAMKKAMQVTTAEMRQIEFTVTSIDGQSVGGTCSITGWVKTTPIRNGTGQGVRSLQKCTWRVFKADSTKPEGEWKK